MIKIKLLLLALPLLLCGCASDKSTTQPAYKQELYTYIEKNYPNMYVITVEFRNTEAKTFDYEYIVADVYYTIGAVYSKEFLIAVKDGSIYQVGEVNR